MNPAVLLGLVLLLDAGFAAEESCASRCGSFDPRSKCQCDSMCVYYGSCCADFDAVCPRKIARGDNFADVEDLTANETTTERPTFAPTSGTFTATTASITPPTATGAGHPDAAACSGRPFDAFLQLKNGSTYGFRGEYFFELDDKSVLPGYPKLIQDVWGISGPIDAAFTRINCEGKSYIFKGDKYWRFDGAVLDEDYPRLISEGFDNVPNDIQAAFAVPAPSHRGKEKAYFFKGDRYHQYDFKQQPSHEECFHLSQSSPSLLFTRYTDLFCDQTWEDFFSELFGGPISSSPSGPRSISRDWFGIRPPVDATLVGRVYLSPKPTPSPARRRGGQRRRGPSRRHRQRGRQHHRHIFDLWGYDDLFDYSDFSSMTDESPTQQYRSTPVQNVYFFRRDKYYRVNLQTRRVAVANPPYPRSIAKYWLGCDREEAPGATRAEKK